MSRLDAALERIQRWDERLCLRCNRALRYRALPQVCRAVSWLGNGIFWYALMLTLLLSRQDAVLPVVHMAGAGLACTLVYKLLKRGTLRPRPYQVHASITQGALPLDTFSFPSGHTLHAVAFSLVALAYYPSLAALLVPFTLLTALSRVVLGLHYPSDVLAGAALGALIGAGSLALG
ncbi:MAG: phosphatase PAP2 family protein [Burkholderiales bacterium]